MGGLDMLEAFSMRKPRAYFSDPVVHLCPLVKRSSKCTLVPCDYANSVELVFIIGAFLICARPCPEAGSLGTQ